MTTTLAPSVPALAKAADAAWSAYASACQYGSRIAQPERVAAYDRAITAQRALWKAQGYAR